MIYIEETKHLCYFEIVEKDKILFGRKEIKQYTACFVIREIRPVFWPYNIRGEVAKAGIPLSVSILAKIRSLYSSQNVKVIRLSV